MTTGILILAGKLGMDGLSCIQWDSAIHPDIDPPP